MSIFTLPDKKTLELCRLMSIEPNRLQIRCRKLAKKVFLALKEGKPYVSVKTGTLELDLKDYHLCSRGNNIYLQFPYHVEEYLRHIIPKLKAVSRDILDQTFEIPEFLSDEQVQAFTHCVTSAFSVITGPAGSGKSLLIRVLVDYFKHKGMAVGTGSYTGKSVSNLRKLLGSDEPRTLHSLLGMAKREKFKLHVLIIDEVSMLTAELLYSILRTFSQVPKLILFGDPNQLPPVSWGHMEIIGDMRLSRCFRFEGEILKNANGLLNGRKPKDKGNFKLIEGDVDSVIEAYKLLSDEYQVQIITPFRKAAKQINQKIQEYQKSIRRTNEKITDSKNKEWYVGDKIIFLENNDRHNVFNGEDGFILDINEKNVILRMGNKEVPVSADIPQNTEGDDSDSEDPEVQQKMDLLGEWNNSEEPTTKCIDLAFCLTIHKSQGSQWPALIFYFPWYSEKFTSRNLNYTAITRAQEICIVIGNLDFFYQACQNLTKNYFMDIKL